MLGSSRPRPGEPAYNLAQGLGRELARRGATVVCGGYGGTMEAACRGAAEQKGASIGVVVAGGGPPNPWVGRVVEASDLADRLRRLRDLSDSAIFLPHGLGTLLEIVWFAESIAKAIAPHRPLVFLGDSWRSAVEMAIEEAATEPGRQSLRSCVVFVEGVDAAVREVGP